MSELPAPCAESTLTARFQTTVPRPVRKALGVGKGDRLVYSILSDNQVVITRKEPEGEDPVLGKFLAFLSKDIEKNPQQLRDISPDLMERASALTDGTEVELDSPLSDEDE